MSQSTPLRVLFLGKDATRGGMQKEMLSLVQFLDKKRFSPLILLEKGGDLLPFFKQAAHTEVHSEWVSKQKKSQPSPRLRRWLPDGLTERLFPNHDTQWADELMRQFNPQLIVRQYMRPTPIYRSLEASSLPTLQTFLMAGAQTERLGEDTLRWISQHPIVYPGRGTGNFLEYCLNVKPENMHEIRTGLDLDFIEEQLKQPDLVTRASLGITEDEIVIATSGNIVFLKGVDLWVGAAASIRDRFPDLRFKFVWIGGTPQHYESLYYKGIRSMIQKLNLENHVIITGDQKEIYSYVRLCDIYVQPSRDDAFPGATCEAMALSKPVVAFPQGVALEDYARHALTIVPVFEPQALADAIVQLAREKTEWARLGAAGRQVIEDHLEIKGSMQRYEKLLLKLAQQSPVA